MKKRTNKRSKKIITTDEDQYKLVGDFRTDIAHIIIYEPILTKEEQKRRLQALRTSMRDFMTGYYKKKE